MKRFLVVAIVAGVAAIVAACGSALGATSGSPGATNTSNATVSTRQVSGTGTVLVDTSGQALYAADQEAKGKVMCTGACNAIWMPLTITKGSPTGSGTGGTLGVVTRPDGTTQVTFDGKPLYTFYLDKPGQVTADNFADAFGSQHFTWHVVRVGGTAGSSGGQSGGQSPSSAPRGYSNPGPLGY